MGWGRETETRRETREKDIKANRQEEKGSKVEGEREERQTERSIERK